MLFPEARFSILHISDTHLPPKAATNEGIDHKAWQALWNRRVDEKPLGEAIDLLVHTGDVALASPDRRLYRALRDDLDRRLTADRWMAIPGNHDRRTWGNLFYNVHAFDSLRDSWNRARWAANWPCVIVPLDSNPDKKRTLRGGLALARGVMGTETSRLCSELASVQGRMREHYSDLLSRRTSEEVYQIARRFLCAFNAAHFEEILKGEPGAGQQSVSKVLVGILARYAFARAAKIVLVHHHPIGVPDTENAGVTSQDAYLLMTDAGEFLRCLRHEGVNLVLHGHKHRPHRIALTLPGVDAEAVGVVGAGSITRGNGHNQATGNLIRVGADGGIDVDLFHLGRSELNATASLALRRWTHVRQAIRRVAGAEVSTNARSVAVDVLIFPETGDCVVTREYLGVQCPRDKLPLQLPIAARSQQITSLEYDVELEHPSPGQATRHDLTEVGTGNDPGMRIAMLELDATSPSASANRRSEGPSFRVATQVVALSSFAVNGWQARHLFGSDKAALRESYRFTSSLPIQEQLTLTVRLRASERSPLRFSDPFTVFERPDARPERSEGDEVRLHQSFDRTQVRAAVMEPIWGYRYGLQWTWSRRVAGAYQAVGEDGAEIAATGPLADETTRERLQRSALASAERHGAVAAAAAEALGMLPTEYDATVYSLAASTEGRAQLVQLACNAGASRRPDHIERLPFGAGVAGRAAWMRAVTLWHDGLEKHTLGSLVDCHLRARDTVPHKAVIAVPIPNGWPCFILQVGSSQPSFRAAVVQAASNNNLADLEEIEPILQVAGKLAKIDWLARLSEDENG
ncbi:MAG: metallophosphoesterase [Myxococcales bacterium]|nr:metallophosphoesterase [Myxococcales bacterium]